MIKSHLLYQLSYEVIASIISMIAGTKIRTLFLLYNISPVFFSFISLLVPFRLAFSVIGKRGASQIKGPGDRPF